MGATLRALGDTTHARDLLVMTPSESLLALQAWQELTVQRTDSTLKIVRCISDYI